MAKVNVYDLKRKSASRVETKTFKDAAQGVDFTFTLRALTSTEQFAALDYGQSLMATYVGSDDAPAQARLPAVDGRIPTPSASLCLMLGQIVYAQSGEDEESYSFEELVAIAETCPSVFAELQKWYQSLGVQADPKGSDTASSSAE